MASNAYYASQDRMDEAIEAISNGVFKKIADCARFYGVNRNTLSGRLHEKSSRSARIALNKRLIDAEEHSLMAYIRYYDEKNLSIIPKLLIEAANFLIHVRNPSAKSVEDSWFKRFLKRHLEVKKRRTRFILTERKNAYEIKKLKMYFKQLNETLNEHEVIASNTWNMNEINFHINCDKDRIVLTLNIQKSSKIIDSDNREYLTFIKIINDEENSILFMFIAKNVDSILHRMIIDNDFYKNITLITSEVAYINEDFALNWFRHFIKNVQWKRVDQWIFLLIDNHDFYKTYSFWKLIQDNYIVLFMLSSHFTHILQPLNVNVFQIYKYHHELAINKVIKQKNVRFDRYDFLIVFDEFRQITFKSIIIKYVWKRCDIISINLNIVLKLLKKKHVVEVILNRFITASSDFDDWLKRTSCELRSVQKNIKIFRKKYKEIDEFEIIYDQH